MQQIDIKPIQVSSGSAHHFTSSSSSWRALYVLHTAYPLTTPPLPHISSSFTTGRLHSTPILTLAEATDGDDALGRDTHAFLNLLVVTLLRTPTWQQPFAFQGLPSRFMPSMTGGTSLLMLDDFALKGTPR
ncbi:hypothetical protein NMY22_g13562 [Coprinellus aureogranulatus]|nr:hypothetical protein NMY22_g13562 [Coprinellus aureogranulatus]